MKGSNKGKSVIMETGVRAAILQTPFPINFASDSQSTADHASQFIDITKKQVELEDIKILAQVSKRHVKSWHYSRTGAYGRTYKKQSVQ